MQRFSQSLLVLAAFFSVAASARPVFRYYNGRFHFYSTDSHSAQNGYYLEGQVFDVHQRFEQGRVGLYRCLIRGTNAEFLSTNGGCEGQQPVALLGYIGAGATHGGAAPLYRCFQPQTGDHLSTKLVNECTQNGYNVEGVVGYVR